MILCQMTLGLTPRGNLRHVHDGLSPDLFCGLGKIRCTFDDSRCQRIKEIGRTDAFHRRTNVIDIGEVADGNFNATRP
ncbi:hypothetical protein D3C86_1686380 [compost metagenome]